MNPVRRITGEAILLTLGAYTFGAVAVLFWPATSSNLGGLFVARLCARIVRCVAILH